MPKVHEQPTPAGRLHDWRVPLAKRGQGPASAPVTAIGMRKIYSGAQTGTGSSRAGAPLDGAAAELLLPIAPTFMLVRAGWRLYSGSSVNTEGYTEALYAEGDTHVRSHFGNVNWAEFENIGVLSGDVATVAVGLLSDTIQYANAFTLEYEPATRKLAFLAVNDPASSLIPVVHSLIVAGS